MFFNEAGRMFAQWLPVAQATITLSLSGFGLLVILLAICAYWGYQQGFRYLITVAVWTIVGYILHLSLLIGFFFSYLFYTRLCCIL